MSPRDDDYEYCKMGCGKPVMNALGICMPCRSVKCLDCKELFAVKTKGEKRCSHCRRNRKNLANRVGDG